jgi:polysaccharide chain length determinant protein (PEP-CTERM system associated)
MQTERDALALAYRDMRVLQSKREQLNEQLSGEQAVVPGVTDAATEPPPGSLDARIRDAETRLDTMLLEFTERHPDVIALREAIGRLRAQRSEQLAALGVDDTDHELYGLEANPVYQALRGAITETDVEIATLRADIQEREARVEELQGLIDEVPEVEAELARLNRDYEVIYEQYLALVRSRETQELTRKATDTDQVDFRIIDPPSASLTPVAPNRLTLLGIVFAAAIGIGAGLCYLLAQLSPVFSNSNALRQRVGFPVLGVVTQAWHESWRSRRRRAIGLYASALATLVLVFASLVGLELLGPGLHQVIAERI